MFYYSQVNDLHLKSFVNQLFLSTRTQGYTVDDCIGTKSPGNRSGLTPSGNYATKGHYFTPFWWEDGKNWNSKSEKTLGLRK